jgi:hypothetical protein
LGGTGGVRACAEMGWWLFRALSEGEVKMDDSALLSGAL